MHSLWSVNKSESIGWTSRQGRCGPQLHTPHLCPHWPWPLSARPSSVLVSSALSSPPLSSPRACVAVSRVPTPQCQGFSGLLSWGSRLQAPAQVGRVEWAEHQSSGLCQGVSLAASLEPRPVQECASQRLPGPPSGWGNPIMRSLSLSWTCPWFNHPVLWPHPVARCHHPPCPFHGQSSPFCRGHHCPRSLNKG